jgi:hypothetical protein
VIARLLELAVDELRALVGDARALVRVVDRAERAIPAGVAVDVGADRNARESAVAVLSDARAREMFVRRALGEMDDDVLGAAL